MLCVTLPCCLGHLLFGLVNGSMFIAVISADDIAHWPYTSGILVKWVALIGSLHWPAGGLDLGVGGFFICCTAHSL